MPRGLLVTFGLGDEVQIAPKPTPGPRTSSFISGADSFPYQPAEVAIGGNGAGDAPPKTEGNGNGSGQPVALQNTPGSAASPRDVLIGIALIGGAFFLTASLLRKGFS